MKKLVSAIFIVLIITILYFVFFKSPKPKVIKTDSSAASAEDILSNEAANLNKKGFSFVVNGQEIVDEKYMPYLNKNMKIMVPVNALSDLLDCSANEYTNGTISLEKGTNTVKFFGDSGIIGINGASKEIGAIPETKDDVTFVPVEEILETLNYTFKYSYENNRISFDMISADKEKIPDRYDMREHERVSAVRSQGIYGTCWAFASLGALESTLLPAEKLTFSVDHMSLNNGFGMSQFEGGQYAMSIAYLSSWKGPVLEESDPYGDEKTVNGLNAVKHLEEAQIISGKDYKAVKTAVYKYGAVETVIYSDMKNATSTSPYYNPERAAYCYSGDKSPNHDIIIVGWDDNYKRENFPIAPEGDGAFICKNSWGIEFGQFGYFYISYYDANICNYSVVYTKVGDPDNYDNIYQSDELGWVGNMGYDKSQAFFANVYKAEADELLKAVSFYATGDKTTYEVYVVKNFEDIADMQRRKKIAFGEVAHAGYYTVDIPEEILLDEDERFAVVININTPDSELPIAVEYYSEGKTENFDKSDGEGYISLYGSSWTRTETDKDCNVCLKAFTENR